MKKISYILLLIVFCGNIFAQDTLQYIHNKFEDFISFRFSYGNIFFEDIKMPKTDRELATEIDFENKFKVKTYQKRFAVEVFYKEKDTFDLGIKGGTLIGIDNGSFGGKLIFKPILKKGKIIVEDNIRLLFKFNKKYYFVMGYQFAEGSGRGTLCELIRNKNEFSYKKIIEFENIPQALKVFKDKIYIATKNEFYIIDNFEIKSFFKNIQWSNFSPNSIVIVNKYDGENIYVGMTGGIAKINIIDKEITFYKGEVVAWENITYCY